jgi:hypothetical protein
MFGALGLYFECVYGAPVSAQTDTYQPTPSIPPNKQDAPIAATLVSFEPSYHVDLDLKRLPAAVHLWPRNAG